MAADSAQRFLAEMDHVQFPLNASVRQQPSMVSPPNRGLVALVSVSGKRHNEDFGRYLIGDSFSLLAIADGVGSSVDAHVAANIAVLTAIEDAEQMGQGGFGAEAIRALFTAAATALQRHFHEHEDRYLNVPRPLQTTLILVIEEEDSYWIGYVGNGSVFVVRGEFVSLREARPIFLAADVMSAHVSLREGRDVLYGVLDPSGVTAEIGLVRVWKDRERGEAIVVCTDGLNSAEQLRTGSDSAGKLWREVNTDVIALLYDYLAEFASARAEPNDTGVRFQATLNSFVASRTFDDDVTIGVVMSPAVLAAARTDR